MKTRNDYYVLLFNELFIISEWEERQQKYQSDNTNKIFMSKGFGGNKYSKNSWIMYIIHDKF